MFLWDEKKYYLKLQRELVDYLKVRLTKDQNKLLNPMKMEEGIRRSIDFLEISDEGKEKLRERIKGGMQVEGTLEYFIEVINNDGGVTNENL